MVHNPHFISRWNPEAATRVTKVCHSQEVSWGLGKTQEGRLCLEILCFQPFSLYSRSRKITTPSKINNGTMPFSQTIASNRSIGESIFQTWILGASKCGFSAGHLAWHKTATVEAPYALGPKHYATRNSRDSTPEQWIDCDFLPHALLLNKDSCCPAGYDSK